MDLNTGGTHTFGRVWKKQSFLAAHTWSGNQLICRTLRPLWSGQWRQLRSTNALTPSLSACLLLMRLNCTKHDCIAVTIIISINNMQCLPLHHNKHPQIVSKQRECVPGFVGSGVNGTTNTHTTKHSQSSSHYCIMSSDFFSSNEAFSGATLLSS